MCRPVAAAQIDGDKIYYKSSPSADRCFGVFLAAQRFTAATDDHRVRLLGICSPADARTTQYVRIFLNYADAHPERLNEDFAIVVLAALQNAWPCLAPVGPTIKH